MVPASSSQSPAVVTTAAIEGVGPVTERARAPSAPARPTLAEAFERGFPYVHKSLRRLGVRDADLEDLAHDVFVVAHRQLERYDPERPLLPWLFGIAVRVAS